MIYKLDQLYLTEADITGMHFICMSYNGLYFLAQSDVLPSSIESIEEYDDVMETQLMQDKEWIQPTEPK